MINIYTFVKSIWNSLFTINIPVINMSFGQLSIITFIIFTLSSYLSKFIRR